MVIQSNVIGISIFGGSILFTYNAFSQQTLIANKVKTYAYKREWEVHTSEQEWI